MYRALSRLSHRCPAPLAAALAGGTGKSRITETIFDRRFRYTEGLCAMGAAIQVEGDTAYILGRPLHGAQVAATDLRGGAALTVAALGAQGPSRIWGLDHVDRGYEGLETALAALGETFAGRPARKAEQETPAFCGRREGVWSGRPGTGAAFRPVKGNRIWQRKKKNADIANGGEASPTPFWRSSSLPPRWWRPARSFSGWKR
ncbi:MAG: hypothetical protein ACLSCQ_10155 [Evtepia gabavorous]